MGVIATDRRRGILILVVVGLSVVACGREVSPRRRTDLTATVEIPAKTREYGPGATLELRETSATEQEPEATATHEPLRSEAPTATLPPSTDEKESVSSLAVTQAQSTTLKIINDSGSDIWRLTLSPPGSDQWSDDYLGDAVITAGESMTLTSSSSGTYDVLVEGELTNDIEILFGVALERDVTWRVTGSEGDTASLMIVNRSRVEIGHVTLAPSYSDEWGEDLLGGRFIAPGERFARAGIPCGIYDMKAETADHVVIDVGYEQTVDGPRTWEVVGGDGAFVPRLDQWAVSAAASSERSASDGSARQAVGEPDTSHCVDSPTAWASAESNGVEWLELTFAVSVVPRRINVHETNSPGSIVRVEVVDESDQYHTVWEGEPPPVAECPRVFSFLTTEIDVRVKKVRIHLDQRGRDTRTEIDAVELVGLDVDS